tara:strand:- start:91 stop:798 length:708 start_codon:yes stop_codon:yes gene_type:complete
MIKKAMILAAGFGKRVHPLTLKNPKPLLRIGDETLLSNTLKFLELNEIKEVVINVHYLGEQIINYIQNNKFNLNIKIVKEEDKILNTGGGILNAIQHFSDSPFLIINPDTIWNSNYFEEIKLMEKLFFQNKKNKCSLLVVKKEKSFDKSFKGDFNLKNNLINRNQKDNFEYIYTGAQIIKPDVFSNLTEKVFSINRIWDNLIKNNELSGLESKNDFLHVSTLDIYKDLLKNLDIK